ncbi:hypothetical protein [Flavobacterium terrigena]|uniref:Uncharacterized protein n=1 Tax=Flavobacterium terrigena TaxID=402734 RepID=A0A1H6WB21_9FLAO|nr:hypothetical protein [Flavobacterium terrigena]SEJ14083.1 hypothetical protein SAMN05660918_2510 [Flavobacterium terrigena]
MISDFIILFTVSDWINFISAISALLTAAVTFITVREIKKQREHSYHPDINIANFEFYVYKYDIDEEENEEEENIFSLYYSSKKLSEMDPKRGYNELTIDISNIGLGVAKQVSWNWFVDFNEIQKTLQSSKKNLS